MSPQIILYSAIPPFHPAVFLCPRGKLRRVLHFARSPPARMAASPPAAGPDGYARKAKSHHFIKAQMDNNTWLARYYRAEVPQIVNCNGIQWMHEVGGDWRPICVFE